MESHANHIFACIAQVYYPTPNTVFYAGTQGRFEYNPQGFTPNDTVSLFFDEDRSTSLACE